TIMSICQASEGILQTHVKWEEFEENLTKALNTTARFGPNKSVIDIGEGNGYASRCGLIQCDWEGEGAEKLPKRVVLKMGSCMALVALSQSTGEARIFKGATPEVWKMIEHNIKEAHNIECDTYDFVEQFGEGKHAIPKRYYARHFTDENVLTGQICMEFVENGRMMNFGEKYNIDQLKQIARALGKLQADSMKYEIVSEALKTKDVFGDFARDTTLEKFCSMYTSLRIVDASLTDAIDAMEALLPEYYGSTVPSTLHKQLGFAPVIVNGDMRTENILVDNDSGDIRALIDWQSTHLGIGVEDLLRISFFAQSADDRRASSDVLIEELYTAFISNLGSLPVPYSLEQLKEFYDILFPHCALFFATALKIVMPGMKPEEEDGEEKKRKYEVVVDKASGVLEDIVTYHKKNNKSKHSVNWKYPAA
ncbi:hypothetical protein PFISCL1PPCAC_14504, partial [Pristionchus fissidentatus]